MTLEEKIKLIEEKIANLPSEFDVEERHIIDNNPRLIELIHQTLLSNPHLFNDEVCCTAYPAPADRDRKVFRYFPFADDAGFP